VEEPRRRFDRLALTVMAVALAAIVGIASFLVYRLRTDTQSPQPVAGDEHLRDAIAEVRKWIEESPRPAPPVAVIEATLSYIDGGSVQASAKETLWYMPAVRQVAKVVREGATPDESATRIVAELVDFR
jgi:hypothetical protein